VDKRWSAGAAKEWERSNQPVQQCYTNQAISLKRAEVKTLALKKGVLRLLQRIVKVKKTKVNSSIKDDIIQRLKGQCQKSQK
jgi:hypothetical protein